MKFFKRNRIIKRKKNKVSTTVLFWQRTKNALCAAVLVLAPLAVWYGLLQSPCLAISTIQVTGCNRLTASEVVRWAGIREGQNILAFDIHETTERIESNPWVYCALVKRTLPDTVCISVQERQARARVNLDGHIYLLDSSGELFSTDTAATERLPLLQGITDADITSPDPAACRLLQAALQLIASCHAGQYPTTDLTITLDKVFGLTLQDSTAGIQVALGFDDFERKLTLLRMVQDDLSHKGISASAIHITTSQQAFVSVPHEGRGIKKHMVNPLPQGGQEAL